MSIKSGNERSQIDERVMIDIISSVPGFKPPSQARTREMTYAIMSASVELLRTRSYATIKMQDIAEKAGCAVTAIYARFSDKNALLSAIHLLLLQQSRPLLDREIRVENFSETGLYGLACAFVRVNEQFFGENVNFVIAAITVNDGNVYRITADIMDAYALRLATVAAELMTVPVDEIVASVKFAIQTILSIYRDSTMASEYFAMPSLNALAHLFTSIVEQRLTH